MGIQEILEGIGLFQGLSREEVECVTQVCQERNYQQGELIFSEGSLGNELCIVKSGKVAIQIVGRGYSPATIIHIVEPNQIFGELALIDQERRSASAKAISDCEILVLPREDLYRVFDLNPHIGQLVMHNIATVVASRLRKTNLLLQASESWR